MARVDLVVYRTGMVMVVPPVGRGHEASYVKHGRKLTERRGASGILRPDDMITDGCYSCIGADSVDANREGKELR